MPTNSSFYPIRPMFRGKFPAHFPMRTQIQQSALKIIAIISSFVCGKGLFKFDYTIYTDTSSFFLPLTGQEINLDLDEKI